MYLHTLKLTVVKLTQFANALMLTLVHKEKLADVKAEHHLNAESPMYEHEGKLIVVKRKQ